MKFIESLKTCLIKKYLTISGRATRSEFWWFMLFVFFCVSILPGFLFTITPIAIKQAPAFLVLLSLLLLTIPTITATIRRLHDVQHISVWIFILIFLSTIILYLAVTMLVQNNIINIDQINGFRLIAYAYGIMKATHNCLILYLIFSLTRKTEQQNNKYGPIPDITDVW